MILAYLNAGLWSIGNGLISTTLIVYLALEHTSDLVLARPGVAIVAGTMSGSIRMHGTAKTLNKGVLSWGRDLFTLTIAAQERLLNQMLTHRLRTERHMRIDTKLEKDQANDIGLDVVSPAAIRALKGQAANSFQFSINDPRLREMLAHAPAQPVFHYGKRKNT